MSAGRRFRLALAPLLRAGNAARVSRLASIALAIGAKPVSAVVRMRALVHMMLRARQAAWASTMLRRERACNPSQLRERFVDRVARSIARVNGPGGSETMKHMAALAPSPAVLLHKRAT
jgi:hypothetical protein